MAVIRTIKIASVFPAPVDVVWARLQRLDTLRRIARPYAAFEPIGAASPVWREGETARFELRLFGFIPLGIHTISVSAFDRETLTVRTREGNRRVPIWNHTITLKPLSGNETAYTDEVEMFAGFATPIVRVWSVMFYRHRQKAWRKLLLNSGGHTG